MDHNLDVYAVQGIKDELAYSVSQIKDGFNYIYSNLLCFFFVGDKEITTKRFDTILYNEESDILIMLLKGGAATKQDLIDELEKNGKEYGEITFDKLDDEEILDDNLPEFWFAREQYVLEEGLDDSLGKGISTCEVYPNVEGSITLSYLTNHTNTEVPIDGRILKGVVALDDKWIFLVNQKDNVDSYGDLRNLRLEKVLEVIDERGITCTINNSINMPLTSEKVTK